MPINIVDFKRVPFLALRRLSGPLATRRVLPPRLSLISIRARPPRRPLGFFLLLEAAREMRTINHGTFRYIRRDGRTGDSTAALRCAPKARAPSQQKIGARASGNVVVCPANLGFRAEFLSRDPTPGLLGNIYRVVPYMYLSTHILAYSYTYYGNVSRTLTPTPSNCARLHRVVVVVAATMYQPCMA